MFELIDYFERDAISDFEGDITSVILLFHKNAIFISKNFMNQYVSVAVMTKERVQSNWSWCADSGEVWSDMSIGQHCTSLLWIFGCGSM